MVLHLSHSVRKVYLPKMIYILVVGEGTINLSHVYVYFLKILFLIFLFVSLSLIDLYNLVYIRATLATCFIHFILNLEPKQKNICSSCL
jgi:hypothetical protein